MITTIIYFLVRLNKSRFQQLQKQNMAEGKTNLTFLSMMIILSSLSLVVYTQNAEGYRTAQTLDYNYIFNQKSDLSVVVLSCGGIKKLSSTLKSFFYFNTYLINKVYIAHCSNQQIAISAALPYGYEANKLKFQIIPAKENTNGIIHALQTIYGKITTKYIYQTDAVWATTKGFGFIQQAISILKYSTTNQLKISQIVTNYPYWRALARLTQLKWTDSGQAFHQIIPFDPSTYQFFALSPSVIDFENLFKNVLKKELKDICSQQNCPNQKFEFDKCCLSAIGKQIHKNSYFQVFLNDGSGQPNHIFLKQ